MTLYKFYKSSCAPCVTLSAILKTITIPDSIKLVELDVENDDSKELLVKHKITQVPVLLFEDGRKFTGAGTRQSILDFISGEVS
jgi:glutaredoxin